MDREIVFAVLIAAVFTVMASSYYFGDTPSTEKAAYAPDDIRFPIQQAEEKAKAKEAKKRKKPVAATAESYASEDYADSSIDESDIEQPPAEEPELE